MQPGRTQAASNPAARQDGDSAGAKGKAETLSPRVSAVPEGLVLDGNRDGMRVATHAPERKPNPGRTHAASTPAARQDRGSDAAKGTAGLQPTRVNAEDYAPTPQSATAISHAAGQPPVTSTRTQPQKTTANWQGVQEKAAMGVTERLPPGRETARAPEDGFTSVVNRRARSKSSTQATDGKAASGPLRVPKTGRTQREGKTGIQFRSESLTAKDPSHGKGVGADDVVAPPARDPCCKRDPDTNGKVEERDNPREAPEDGPGRDGGGGKDVSVTRSGPKTYADVVTAAKTTTDPKRWAGFQLPRNPPFYIQP